MTGLREDLLHGRAIALAGGVPTMIRGELLRLGARVEVVGDGGVAGGGAARAGAAGREGGEAGVSDGDAMSVAGGEGGGVGGSDGGALDEDRAQEWARARAPLHGLVYDARTAFAQGGPAGLQAAVEAAWIATRAVATGALIPAEHGTIVLLAPRADAGPHAQAARAALENLARTLSTEWARFAVKVTMIAPGATTTDEELATLVAFLVSPAGDYFSGCRFDLGIVGEGGAAP